MLPERFTEKLTKLSEEDLFDILDAVSKEVKRRSGLNDLDPNQSTIIKENLKLVLDTLSKTNI